MTSTRIVHMRSHGTSVLLTVGHLGDAAVQYWGTVLPSGSAGRSAYAATATMEVDNDPDIVVEPGIIPGSWTGWTGRPGLVGRRDGGRDWSARLTLTAIEVRDGTGTHVVSPGEVYETDPTVADHDVEARLTLRDAGCALTVEVTARIVVGGNLQLAAVLRNDAATAYHLDELSLALPVPLEATEVLDCTGRWGRERTPQRTTLTFGTHLREGRHGRTGFDAPTLMAVGEPGFTFSHGRLHALHVAAPANHRTYIERVPEGRALLGGGELLEPGEVTLEAGEEYATPTLHFVHGDGLDEAAWRTHTWVRSLPTAPGPQRPVTLNVWEAVTFNHDLPTLLALADEAARIGVERYVLDDGWFSSRRDDTSGLGDWYVSPQAWPDGLEPLTQHVSALGMEFGLWFEPEMVNLDSQVAREHPDWVLRAGSDLPLPWRQQQVLDLTNPQAWEHVRSQMDALLTRYPIRYIKWDHNRDVFDAGSPARGGRAVAGAQMRAALALMDRLRADHPGLEIESCSSGGGRIDLEMVRHVQRFWASDCIDPHQRHGIVPWTEQIIPPEMIGTHVASARNQTTGRVHDLSFRAATAVWGHMGVEWDLTSESAEDRDTLAQWIAFYKQHRHLLATGRLVRDYVGDDTAFLHGQVAVDQRQALYELASLERGVMSHQGRVRLRGLDPQTIYRVQPLIIGQEPAGLIAPPWFASRTPQGYEGLEASGALLSEVGLTAPGLGPDQVLIIHVQAV